MKKFAGTDIIFLMRKAMQDDTLLKEAQYLNHGDFNHDDLLVNFFFNAFPNGFASKNFNREACIKTLDVMENVKKEIFNQGIRKAYSCLQNVRNASNEAVQLENLASEYQSENKLKAQLKAAKLAEFLSKYADSQAMKNELSAVTEEINSGKLTEASDNLRQIFSKHNNLSNIRTAFVTIKQQIGEAYQMCPKGIFQTGQAFPMAISNCRDYCVDARLHPDGSVGCNYIKWLNENVITQEQALNLFNKMPVEQETVNLEPGQRTKFPMSDQDSQDMRMIRLEDVTNRVTTKPWEEQLEAVHKKDKEAPKVKVKTLATDEALEVLLKDCRDVFDEDDLDTLEEQLREAMGE
jgi:hypothetical protein